MIVIGGGVIGIACAYYLLQAGRSVRILERRTTGAGASHGNCGMIVPSHVLPICMPGVVAKSLKWMLHRDSPLYIRPGLNLPLISWLMHFARKCNTHDMLAAATARADILVHSRALYNQLMAEEKLACEWEEKGALMVFRTEQAWEEHAEVDAILRQYDLPARRFNRDETLEKEPALREDVWGAWLYEQDAHLRPDRLLKEWRDLLIDRGIAIEEECAVNGFSIENSAIAGVETARGEFTADTYVLATGAFAPELSRPLGLKIPIQPGKGYSITMSRPALCPSMPCLLVERKIGATPWGSGFRLGGTMEFSGYNDDTNKLRLDALRRGAREYLKDPEGDEVCEEWHGFRPMTYDGLPIIGGSPKQSNLYIAAGHNMIGVATAPATGHLIADLITGRETLMNPAPYAIERFM